MLRGVIAGLDPAIQTYFGFPHTITGLQAERLDCRVRPGNDNWEGSLTMTEAECRSVLRPYQPEPPPPPPPEPDEPPPDEPELDPGAVDAEATVCDRLEPSRSTRAPGSR